VRPAKRRGDSSFTLIEVMLAVAVFAFAAVGFTVALNEMIGINVELLRTGMRRQAVESCAARILAVTNNLQTTKGFRDVEDDGVFFLKARVNLIDPPIELPGTNNSAAPRRLGGWFEVQIQATTKKGAPLESISFLMWPQR
jgi:prepilin-type N-terminal cleavage/methylation domain-containing protein